MDWGQCPSVRPWVVRSSASKLVAEGARPARRAMSDVVVDGDDARQAAQVEHDAAEERHATSRTPRCGRRPR